MPIHSCTLPSGSGWKWGGSGKCYPSRSGAERQAEAAHANGFTGDAAVMAAGIAYIDPEGNVLLLKRSADSDHPGEWCFPGGHIEDSETADQAARRESGEEIGYIPEGDLERLVQIVSDEGVDFTTFVYGVDWKFKPTLNDEHTDFIWTPVNKLPKSTHPGVKAALAHDCQCKACASKRAPTKDAITASGILGVEQIGPKQVKTASGFLLCMDVPIARIGTQEYADIELPDIEAGKDGIILVERTEDEVFNPESIASFEGVPVTIEHPREPVTPDNWIVYAKGVAQNVRRGEGEMSDFLLADLLVMDKGAIHDVETKRLREISNGYDAAYLQIAPGRARQTDIVGNHVALLAGSARCGEQCSVQDSKPLLGDFPMAVKNGADSLRDKLRKLFMTRDSDAFEKTLSEEVKDEGMEGAEGQHIHIHMPGGEKEEATKDDESEADPMAKVVTALDSLAKSVADIGERVSKLETGSQTSDSDEEKEKEETEDDDGDGDGDETMDSDEEEKKDDEKKSTSDSASFRDEFQDAKARAEILAPGVKLPTFDSKADGKKTADSLCVLRRRALRAALDNDNATLVRAITGDADVSKMDCAAAKMAFHAASELVKQKNKAAKTATSDSRNEQKDLNQIHADFWATRKA
jgi:uncharacterized protein